MAALKGFPTYWARMLSLLSQFTYHEGQMRKSLRLPTAINPETSKRHLCTDTIRGCY